VDREETSRKQITYTDREAKKLKVSAQEVTDKIKKNDIFDSISGI
jgi:hypothetical protein